MQEPEVKQASGWQVFPPKTVKFVFQMGVAATAPTAPKPPLNAPSASGPAKADTIYRVLYSPDRQKK
jgi:hypothetical protein